MKEVKLPFRDAKVDAHIGELALHIYQGENEACLMHVTDKHRHTTLIATVDAAGLREAAKLFTEVAGELDTAKAKADEEREPLGWEAG